MPSPAANKADAQGTGFRGHRPGPTRNRAGGCRRGWEHQGRLSRRRSRRPSPAQAILTWLAFKHNTNFHPPPKGASGRGDCAAPCQCLHRSCAWYAAGAVSTSTSSVPCTGPPDRNRTPRRRIGVGAGVGSRPPLALVPTVTAGTAAARKVSRGRQTAVTAAPRQVASLPRVVVLPTRFHAHKSRLGDPSWGASRLWPLAVDRLFQQGRRSCSLRNGSLGRINHLDCSRRRRASST